MIQVRPEQPADAAPIRALLEAAFSTSDEADLVERLRGSEPGRRAWVAADADGVAAYALFTPARADTGPDGLALGPMAVRPDRQGAGVGSLLVRRSLESLAEAGEAWVVVLGHPRYYPRFGFRPAREHGLICPWAAVPDPAFLVRELRPGGLAEVTGTVRYRPEFDAFL